MPSEGSWARCLRALREPGHGGKVRRNRARWDTLAESLKVPQQAMGRRLVACGATHGVMERCNFACSSCYLTEIANALPPLPFREVKEQLDTLRRHLGPAGKTQITSGEVTLLPKEQLGRIVAYARGIGLQPMVMTNGERFLEEPDYLPSLIRDYGLQKVAIHIDTTQAGRKGMPKTATETDIQPIRDRFAALVRKARSRTGKRLDAAQTITVTEKNLEEIGLVMRWVLANADAFRIVSFQPTAQVGRTLDTTTRKMTLEAVWERVCDGVGLPLNRDALRFGHPECNIVCPMIVVTFSGTPRVVESVRRGNGWDLRMARRIMDVFGSLVVARSTRPELALRILSLLVRNPAFVLEAPFYALYRLWGIRSWITSALLHLWTLRITPFAIVVQKFMSPEELETPLGRERLDACSFKVPVDGRMVSMCEPNATGLRRSLNEELRGRSMAPMGTVRSATDTTSEPQRWIGQDDRTVLLP